MRKKSDLFLNILTYCSSFVGIFLLCSIFLFILGKGGSYVNLDLLTKNYWSKNYLVAMEENKNTTTFTAPETLADNAVFSEKWGIALVDHVGNDKQHVVLLEYIDENSPFMMLVDTSAGANQGKSFAFEVGTQIEKIDYTKSDGQADFTGVLANEDAATIVSRLKDASNISTCYLKTPGGGVRGSLITTLILIVVSLAIALPLGLSAAVYLNEYAKKSRINSLIRSAIETLTGVPSIIYGLMGVTVLFPLTRMVGATTTNILLGSLTMAIILLPTIIRSSEEALLVVPDSLRDASLSLGATQTQTIFKVILPCAVPGILTGVLLSIGRVIGESAALIYTMGSFINDSPTLLSQGTSLAVHIWTIMSGEQPNFELASAISLIILAFVLVLNISVKLISKRFNRAWN